MLDSDTLELVREILAAAHGKKAFDITALDVSGLTSFTDVFVICSTSSDRHLDAVATEIRKSLKSQRKPLHIEGSGGGQWILIDFAEVIVHIFTEERRAFYNLEGLWGDAPEIEDQAGEAGNHEALVDSAE